MALSCLSDVPFSATMIRLLRNILSLSLIHTLTPFLKKWYTHLHRSLVHSPRPGLSPARACVSLRSPWRPFPGWFTIAPGPSQGGTLIRSPQSLPGHQWSHPPRSAHAPSSSPLVYMNMIYSCPLSSRCSSYSAVCDRLSTSVITFIPFRIAHKLLNKIQNKLGLEKTGEKCVDYWLIH